MSDPLLPPELEAEVERRAAARARADRAEADRLRRAVADSEERCRLVAEAINEAVWDLDVPANRLTWGEGLTRLFGHAPEQIRTPEDWYAQIHPADAPRLTAERDAFRAGRSRTWFQNYRMRRADGTWAFVSSKAVTAWDEHGRLRRIAGAVRDVTEREEARQALENEVQERRRAELLARAHSEFLARTLAGLAARPSLDAFLGETLAAIAEALGARDGGIWLWEDEAVLRFHLDLRDGRPGPPPVEGQDAMHIPFAPAGAAALLAEPYRIHTEPDFAADPVYAPHRERLARDGVRSVVTLPLAFGDRLLGALAVRSQVVGDFHPQKFSLAQSLTRFATLAVHLTRLAEEARLAAVLGERTRLARDIHDTLAQGFLGILLHLNAARRHLPDQPPRAQEAIDQALGLARTSLQEARRSVGALRGRAAAAHDLVADLARLAREPAGPGDVPVAFESPEPALPVPPEAVEPVLRIAREAVRNAREHAGAKRIVLRASRAAGGVRLTVEDDGRGFDPEAAPAGRFGLVGMRERADLAGGRLTIASAAGRGTAVVLELPLSGPEGGPA